MPDVNDSLEQLGFLVDVATAAPWLQLDGTEPEAWLESAVYAGNAAVLEWLAWDPRSQEITETVDATGGSALIVSRKRITAISAVNLVLSGGLLAPQDLTTVTWDQDAALIYTACKMPRGRQNVKITYTAGYEVLPQVVIRAVLYTIKAMLDATGVDFNATGESYSGVLNRTFWPSGPGVVPPSAQTLLMRLRRDM